MKTFFTLLLALFVSSAIATNQNASSQEAKKSQATHYQPVFSNRTALFKNVGNDQIIGLRIDSVKTGNETILYPFATIQELDQAWCFSPYKASWIGEKVVVKPNGITLFFNRNGDTITIKTQAAVNEKWIAFNTGTLTIEASVQAIEQGNTINLTDSLKTIVFRAIDQNGNTVSHTINNKRLIVSQNYGFVETLNFYLFPNLTTWISPQGLCNYNLVGLTNPSHGIQNLTWFDVHNFYVGDELHIQEHNIGDSHNYDPLREYDNRCIYKYIERTNYPDSIVYQYTRQQSIKKVYADSTNNKHINDTVNWVVHANPNFDKLPSEPFFEDISVSQTYMLFNEQREKIDPSSYLRYVENGSYFSKIEGEGCLIDEHYIEGLGGPYYYCSGYVGETEERKLVYYKKGTTEWGTKLVLTSAPTLQNNNMLQVLYNPASNELTFQLNEGEGKHRVNLFNQAGQLVKSKQFNGSELKLSLTSLKSGIYLYRITTQKGEVQTGKVVVK